MTPHLTTRIRRATTVAVVVSLCTLYPGATTAQRKSAVPSKADARSVLHVLNRLGFGARPGDVERVQKMGLAAYIEQQLHPEKIDNSAVDARLAEFTTLEMSARDLAQDFIMPAIEQRKELQQQQAQQARNTPPPPPAGSDPTMTPPPAQQPPAQVRQLTAEQRMIQQQRQAVGQELMQAKMIRATISERQLEEVLVDFWFNHFNVFIGKGQVRQYITEYERDAIRPHVFGKFREMLGATAHSPAMLFYLDNYQSQAPAGAETLANNNRGQIRNGRFGVNMARPGQGGQGQARPGRTDPPQNRPNPNNPNNPNKPNPNNPNQPPQTQAGQNPPQNPQPPRPQPQRPQRGLNENYARELMELHTLGVDGGYTQQDVIEVARILTGWTIDRPPQGGSFIFRPQVHDAGEKKVLGVKFPAGHGEEEGEKLLDLLASHPSTAKHIAFKLAQRFVADEPPAALVDRAAKTFLDTKGDLRAVTRVIVTSPEFFSEDYYGAKVKTPLEFVVSAARAANANVVNAQPMIAAMRDLGMPLYGCQPPTGYSMTSDAWVNTGSLLNRLNFAMQLVSGGAIRPNVNAPRPNQPVRPNQPRPNQGFGLEGRQGQMARAQIQVDVATLAADTSEASRDRLIDQWLAGEASATTRTTLARAESPQQLIALTLGSPEFQKR
jgi:uncharacterized protein (DUF1800 family)